MNISGDQYFQVGIKYHPQLLATDSSYYFLKAYWLVTVYLPPARKNTWTWSDDIWDGHCLKFRVKVEFLCDVER